MSVDKTVERTACGASEASGAAVQQAHDPHSYHKQNLPRAHQNTLFWLDSTLIWLDSALIWLDFAVIWLDFALIWFDSALIWLDFALACFTFDLA